MSDNTTPDQSRTPELPEPDVRSWSPATHDTAGYWICTHSTDQLRDYGAACVAAAMAGRDKVLDELTLACAQAASDEGWDDAGYSRFKTAYASAMAASPPPDVQEAEPVAHAEYTPVSESHEAAIDEALGLTKMILRFPRELLDKLRGEADANGVVLAAHIRDRLSHPPSGDAEDARDAARYRWLVANVESVEHLDWSWWRDDAFVTPINERIDAMLAKGVGGG